MAAMQRCSTSVINTVRCTLGCNMLSDRRLGIAGMLSTPQQQLRSASHLMQAGQS